MRRLILVRHSLPEVDPAVAPHKWTLSADGRARAETLSFELRRVAPDVVYSSTGLKAVETGEIIAGELGIPLELVDDLHEHAGRGAGDWVSHSEFRARLAEFFGSPSRLVFGTETANESHDRFAAAINGIVADSSCASAAVVSHGTVMALFVSRTNHLDAEEVWDGLTSPGFMTVRIPGFEILETWRFPE